MTAVARLLAKIERHCETAAIAETTFGRRAVNDGKLVKRLRAGRSITLSTLRPLSTLRRGPTRPRSRLISVRASDIVVRPPAERLARALTKNPIGRSLRLALRTVGEQFYAAALAAFGDRQQALDLLKDVAG